MKYKKFIIENYRAINKIEIDLEKKSLIPIIGVNECGKTTILQALFAFDHLNDKLNNGNHLKNIGNMYKTDNKTTKISSEILITIQELIFCLQKIKNYENRDKQSTNDEELKKIHQKNITKSNNYLKILEKFSDLNTIIISREINGKDKYFINLSKFGDEDFNDILCRQIINRLPYILYFDDFMDSIQEKIYIKDKSKGWGSIMEELFKKTDFNYSISKLPDEEDNKRFSIISDVKRVLNDKITNEWSNFNIDKSEPMKIHINYKEEKKEGDEKGEPYLELKIVETLNDGNERYFDIRNRSKGFYWFFNFVMKLYFNPKKRGFEDRETIYLLDEPGSYLHINAQNQLCKKLKELSENNKVLYCTHSHYLLNPEIIPINNIKIVEKNENGIDLKTVHEFNNKIQRSALQPLWDALGIIPINLDLNYKKIIILEGIIDFYSFEMFNEYLDVIRDTVFLPSKNADSISWYISFMISTQKNYYALWDNDEEGIKERDEAIRDFGEGQSERFLLLNKMNGRKTILQNFYTNEDIELIKNKLHLDLQTGFDKTITTLFFSEKRDNILKKISDKTKNNFKDELLKMKND